MVDIAAEVGDVCLSVGDGGRWWWEVVFLFEEVVEWVRDGGGCEVVGGVVVGVVGVFVVFGDVVDFVLAIVGGYGCSVCREFRYGVD